MSNLDKKHHLKQILLPHNEKRTISPMFVNGHLTVAGLHPKEAYTLAETIIEKIPQNGMNQVEFFKLILEHLPEAAKRRFVTLELVKKYLISPKSSGPLFIFLGGFTGKTFLSTYIQQHLGINRVFSLDEEKYIVKQRHPDHAHLNKATYEEADVYEKTLESFYPRMNERMEEHLHDYSMHKKWTYFWEGLYLSPSVVQKLVKAHPNVYTLQVLLMPDFEEVKRRYKVRWMTEFGVSYMAENKSTIDAYLKNLEGIKDGIMKHATLDNVVMIKPEMFEEVLEEFYQALLHKLAHIAKENNLDTWIGKVLAQPEEITEYERYLES